MSRVSKKADPTTFQTSLTPHSRPGDSSAARRRPTNYSREVVAGGVADDAVLDEVALEEIVQRQFDADYNGGPLRRGPDTLGMAGQSGTGELWRYGGRGCMAGFLGKNL